MKDKSVKDKIKFVLKFAAPHKWKFAIMQLCMILASVTLMILPYIIGWLIDEVLDSQNMSRFIFIVAVYGGVYIFNQAMYTVVNIMEKVISTAFLFDIRAALYSRILNFKGRYLTSIYSGDMISRMGYDVDQIMTMISINLFGLVSSVLNLVIALAFIFHANLWLGIFTALVTPVIIFVSRSFFGKTKRENDLIIRKKGLLSSWTFEILGGMQEIKLLHASKQVISEFLRRSVEIVRLSIDLNRIEVLAERINAGISLAAQMCLFAIAAFLVMNHHLTIGGVTACFAYYTTCITAFKSIHSKILSFSSNLVSCERVMELFEVEREDGGEERLKQQEILENSGKQLKGSIEFKNVSFSYNGEKNLFENLSFRINPCEKIAIVGHSGVGKSTLVNLLCRIQDADSGNIFIDNKDIAEYDIKYLRSQIGVVHQSSIIFNGSIRFNLQFTDDKGRDPFLWEALKMVDLFDFVKGLEDGLDTIVGTGGLSFSGGQKQRIAIARAFVKNSPIMIFDESTSSLDSESESAVQNSWEILGKNHTLLIIAHRLSTIIHADKILVIDDGRVAGFGCHEELLSACEAYNTLFRKQHLSETVQERGNFC